MSEQQGKSRRGIVQRRVIPTRSLFGQAWMASPNGMMLFRRLIPSPAVVVVFAPLTPAPPLPPRDRTDREALVQWLFARRRVEPWARAAAAEWKRLVDLGA